MDYSFNYNNQYNNQRKTSNIENSSKKVCCESKMPFPPIEVSRCNVNYANLLYNAYAASGGSELQAITQYIYHHETILNKEVSETLLCIAIVEMKHLDALAGLIVKLGAKPAFFNSNRSWFSTGELVYGDNVYREECPPSSKDNLCIKLKADIAGEKAAIRGYKDIMSEIYDPKVNAVIEKIISDEKVHVRILKGFLEKYCCNDRH